MWEVVWRVQRKTPKKVGTSAVPIRWQNSSTRQMLVRAQPSQLALLMGYREHRHLLSQMVETLLRCLQLITGLVGAF